MIVIPVVQFTSDQIGVLVIPVVLVLDCLYLLSRTT